MAVEGRQIKRKLIAPVEFEAKRFKPSVDLRTFRNAGLEGFPGLVFVVCSDIGADGKAVLVCSRKDLHRHCSVGLISRVKLIVEESGEYDFQVVMISKEKGKFNNLKAVCEIMSASTGYNLASI